MATATAKKTGAAKPAAKAVKHPEGTITAYNVKTKEKGVVMHNAVISKNSRGIFVASGTTEDGSQKLTTILSKDNAMAALKNKMAKKNFKD